MRTGWERLTWPHRLAILGMAVVTAALTIPCLPPGLCFGDPGDLQVASATLGIAHPPGYVGYATLGFLLTRLVRGDPAYVVSWACCAAGITALTLGALLQVRLGASPWIAATTALLLLQQSRVWVNLVRPEVYAPSLALLAGTIYLLLKYGRLGRSRDLWCCALLFGVLSANRPPAWFAAPFLLAAWWIAERRRTPLRRAALVRGLTAAGWALLPSLYSVAYVACRDRPSTPHNCIEQFTPMEVSLAPPTRATARLERIRWLLSGAQFRALMGNDWNGVRSKLGWIYRDLEPYSPVTLGVILILLPLGAVRIARRGLESVWVLGGTAVANVAFVCFYRVVGQAADLLPLLWVLTVVVGVGLSVLFPHRTGPVRELAAVGLYGLVAALTGVELRPRAQAAFAGDATAYLAVLDLATFPRDAVMVVDDWDARLPICYAKCVQTRREDVAILSPQEWRHAGTPLGDRPVYFVNLRAMPGEYQWVPFRNVWRLEPK